MGSCLLFGRAGWLFWEAANPHPCPWPGMCKWTTTPAERLATHPFYLPPPFTHPKVPRHTPIEISGLLTAANGPPAPLTPTARRTFVSQKPPPHFLLFCLGRSAPQPPHFTPTFHPATPLFGPLGGMDEFVGGAGCAALPRGRCIVGTRPFRRHGKWIPRGSGSLHPFPRFPQLGAQVYL